jgi:membrane-associated phospholipid phosphatase
MATNRSVRPAGWSFDVVLLAALVALTIALSAGALLGTDLAVRDWVDAHRPAPAYWLARTLNLLGQGGLLLVPVSAGLAIALAWRTRSVRPVLVVAAAFVVTYVTIGPFKLLADRGYPHDETLAHPERLFSDPVNGTAYPSGHVANAIVWYGVITLLLAALLRAYGRPAPGRGATWALRVLPVVVVFAVTTYLGFHWLTDAVAGLLLGLLLDRALHRVPWDTLPLPGRLGDWRQPARLGQDRF